MKTKQKLSALDELRLEKAQLMYDCAQEKEKIVNNLGYAKDNWGRLLISTVFSSTKSGVSDVMSLIPGNKKKSKISNAGQMAISMAPIMWDVLQPMLIGFAFRKVKSVFTRKKKKK